MGLGEILLQEWGRVLRAWRAGIGCRFVPFAVAAILMIGVVEPLLCVFHCYLLDAVPAEYARGLESGASVAHAHAHRGAMPPRLAAAAAPGALPAQSPLQTGESDGALCATMSRTPAPAGSPSVLLAVPFHEVASPAALSLLTAGLLSRWWSNGPPALKPVFLDLDPLPPRPRAG